MDGDQPSVKRGNLVPIPVDNRYFPVDEDSIYNFVSAAWSLILHQFVNTEEVSFSIHRSGHNPVTIKVQIQPHEPIRQLLDPSHWHTVCPYQHDQVNSGLVFSSFRSWTTEDFQSIDCQVGLVINHRTLHLLYYPQIMSDQQAGLMASSVTQVFHELFKTPDQAIGAVSLFSEQHLEQISKWNSQYPVLNPSASSIYELIEPICRSKPDAPAIISWDGEVIYSQLDAWTGQLADYLGGLGVKPNTVVALCFEKSLWAVISMLSVIRTGATFVFLDPSHPPPHRNHILSLTQPFLIMASPFQEHVFQDAGFPVIIISEIMMSKLPSTSLPSKCFKPPNDPEDPAFLIFTSGSSGTPKGCLMDHSSLAGIIPLGRKWPFDISCNRIFQFAPFAFGTSLLEIFSALVQGGIICVPSNEEWRNDLVGVINRLEVSGLVLPPSLAKTLSPKMMPTVRMLALGGERLDHAVIHRWVGAVRLVQGYGMSENGGILAFNDNLTRDSNPVNVGQSPNGRFWLVNPDDHNQLAPIGAVAEIIFEGPNVARRYLNLPEKSAEVFVKPPTWLHQFEKTICGQGRFLKTGDLARYNSDGTINHLGRKDSLVKIRGQRVDLREVELSLRPLLAHGIEAFIELANPKNGSPLLAAYIWSKNCELQGRAANHGFAFMPAALRLQLETVDSSLRAKLPSYMLPSVYLLLERLPTTVSGKVDRRKLQANTSLLSRTELESLTHDQGKQVLLPTTPIEEKITQYIAETLMLDTAEVGMNMTFLKLGGDSISAMTFLRKCQAERIRITIQDIFQEPSISSLAKRALELSSSDGTKREKGDSYGLTVTQQRLLGLEQLYPVWTAAIKLPQQFNDSELADAIQSLVIQHPILRSRLVISGNGEVRQTVLKAGEKAHLFQKHGGILNADATQNLQEIDPRSIDPYVGPVFAAHFFKTDNREQVLMLLGHGLFLDTTSWKVIREDLYEIISRSINMPVELRDTPSFQMWCDLVQGLPNTDMISQELSRVGWKDEWKLLSLHKTTKQIHGQTVTLSNEYSQKISGKTLTLLELKPWHVILAALLLSYNDTISNGKPTSFATHIDGRDALSSSLNFCRTGGRFDSTLLYTVSEDLSKISYLELLRRIKDGSWLSLAKGIATHPSAVANVDIVLHQYISLTPNQERIQCGKSIVEEIGTAKSHLDCSGLLEVFTFPSDKAPNEIQLSYRFKESLGSPKRLKEWFSMFQKVLAEILDELQNTKTMFTPFSFPTACFNYEELKVLESEYLPNIGVTKNDDLCDIYPCSPMQEGMLLAQAMVPSRYKVRIMWKASSKNPQGVVCIEKLRRAWSAVVRRHPALRTVLIPHPGDNTKHLQLILSPFKANNLANTIESFDSEPREVCKNSIPRFTIQKTPAEVNCVLEIDHTVFDGVSIEVFFRDLILAYDGSLPAGYVAQVLFDRLDQESMSKKDVKEYWTALLQNRRPCRLPKMNEESRIRNKTATFHSVDVEIGPLSSKLYEFSRLHGVTVANIVQIAWALVLQAFTGQSSVCFGYMVSGRNPTVEGIYDVIGLFADMIVRVVDFSKHKSLLEVIQDSQQDYVDSLPYHQVAASEVLRFLGSQELFNSLVSFTNELVDPLAAEGEINLEVTESLDYSEYDVTLEGSVQNGNFKARIKYWDSVLNIKHAKRIAGMFRRAVDLLLNSSQNESSRAFVLSVEDERQIMEWNDCPPAKIDALVQEYVEVTCEAQPLAPAVCAWNGSFTYQELSTLSSRLAAYLSEFGVNPGAVVPICFEKSCWTPVSMLAVLKAGCTFTLFDPSLPLQRLKDMCQAINSKTMLTSRENVALCTKLEHKSITVDERVIWDNELALANWAVPKREAADTAYIVFTSGSTGAPKCAMIHHSAFLSSALKYSPPLNLDSRARVLQFSSYSFDISISDHLAALLAGGCICIPSSSELKGDLSLVIRNYEVNWAMMTPSVSRIIQPSSVPSLKTLCLIGESLSSSDISSWSEKVCLMNTYGPAETACVSHGNLNLKSEDQSKNFGKGLGATSWIVDQDDHERLLPVGAVGELLIDGPIVGQGYLNATEKTESVFIGCPSWMSRFRPEYNAKLYKTGDLVRYMEDGSIIFCGRKNTQLKIRGQWVELSQVESYSVQCFRGASHCVVEYIEDDSILVGFVPWVDDSLTASESLLLSVTSNFKTEAFAARKRMLDIVPEHMVPTVFIPVSHIPLGQTGKSDRRQLRDILRAMTKQDLSYYRTGTTETVLPRNELETKLQRMYASILEAPLETISVTDDFFHLGGSSLAAMKISSCARLAGLQIGFADIFKHQTIRRLALSLELHKEFPPTTVLGKDRISTAWEESLMLRKDVAAVLPCTPLQHMMLRAQIKEPEVYTIRFSVRITSHSCDIDAAKLNSAFRALVNRHTALRTVFAVNPDNGSYVQVIITGPAASTLDSCPGGSFFQWDMAKFPYEITFSQDTPSTTILTGHMNHALSDARSTPILLQEMASIYANQLPQAAAAEFTHYVHYINNSSSDSMRYWSDYLYRASACLLFPPQKEQGRGQLRNLRIGCSKSFAEINELCQETKHTVPNLIKSIWALTLAFFTHMDSICFGYMTTGRDAPIPEVDQIVGPLLNILICRLDLEESTTFGKVMDAVHEDYLQSLGHHAGTISALQLVEQTISGPLFNTLINHRQYQTSNPNSIRTSELEFTILAQTDPMDFDCVVLVDESPSHLDISLNYWDSFIPENIAVDLGSKFDTIMSCFITHRISRISTVLGGISALPS